MTGRIFAALGALAATACGPTPRAVRPVAFASAAGFESGKPFEVLRFTPSGRGQYVRGTSVKRHPSGGIVVAGVFDGRANLGLGPGQLDDAGTTFVGLYSASGRPEWVRWMARDPSGPRVAVESNGNVIVLSAARHAPQPFGDDHPGTCVEPSCGFVSSIHVLSPTGALQFSQALSTRDERERMRASAVEVGASGEVTVAGTFGVRGDLFVARYAPGAAARRWFTRLRATSGATAAGLALLPDGDAVVTGLTPGPLIVDATSIRPSRETAYVVRLSREDGAARWLRPVEASLSSGPPASTGLAIAADVRGDLFVVARVIDAFPYALVEKLDGRTGEPRWIHAMRKREGEVRGAAIDLAGGTEPIVVVQLLGGGLDTGLGVTRGADAKPGAVVVALASDTGAPKWSRELRTDGRHQASWSVEASSIASLGPTEAVVTGSFSGRALLGEVHAEGPWRSEWRPCDFDEDDDGDSPQRNCGGEWSARAMFVARVAR